MRAALFARVGDDRARVDVLSDAGGPNATNPVTSGLRLVGGNGNDDVTVSSAAVAGPGNDTFTFPSTKFTVRLDIVLADGRAVKDTRTYRTCAGGAKKR